MPRKEQLLGTWWRISERLGDLPDQLVFEANDLYHGAMDRPGTYTLLDVGTFELEGDGVRMSTANDAVKPFRLGLADDELDITDDLGNTVRYKRH